MNEQPNKKNSAAGKQRQQRASRPQAGQNAPAKSKGAVPACTGNQNRHQPQRNNGGQAQRRGQQQSLPPLKVYPLGGLGEIGKNMTVYECAGDMIVVDCGSLFPESDMYGVDLVIPDFSFVEQNRAKIKAVVITHGHEDHIGALPYLLREVNLPIYATRLTVGLIQNKLEEHGLLSSADIHTITVAQKFNLGCFTIEPINVNHSIPDAVAFAIECPAGVVIQTGDFKVDYTPVSGGVIDLNTFAKYGKQGVLALLSDSTNSERAGMSASESKVRDSLEAMFVKAGPKRIIVATFASNLYRVQQIVDLAMKYGRKVAISGRSMLNNTAMARELGYLKAPEDVFIDVEQINKFPPEKVALITTGSQGETLSALSRMAMGNHRNVHVGSEDFIIISATPIPGNEKMVTRVVNSLLKLGAEVIYESMYEVHASGHACSEEQKLIIDLVQPKYFIPVHGEYKHLKRHAETAQAMSIPKENIVIADTGDAIVLTQKGIGLDEPVQAGAVMVDGLGVGDVGSVVLRDRRLLSQDGIVVLAASVEKRTGRLVSDVELFSRGFVYVKESEQLLEEARLAVQKQLQTGQNEPYIDVVSLKAKMRETASSLLYRRTKRSPMILPVLMEV
jgi:ribonuclease J